MTGYVRRLLTVITVVIAAALIAGSLPCFAGQDDSEVKKAALELLLEPDVGDEQAYGLRGFTVSPDGKRLFLGYLHGPAGDAAHVSVYDAETKQKIGEYAPKVDENIPVDPHNYYTKGLAVDNRGFLFVGVTHAETPYCSIYCVDNYYREISHIVEDLGAVTGINGITTQKFGDRILLYVITCYDKDTIRCYDVTDPTDIRPNAEFGEGGVADYYGLTKSNRDAGYIAVDKDGYVYITCLKSSDTDLRKGSHVLKLSPDGKKIVARTEIDEAYGISTAGDYLFVSTYADENSKVYVLNRSDLSTVTSMACGGQEYPLTGTAYGGNYLYVSDQGSEMSYDAGSVKRTKAELTITRDPGETEKVDPGKYQGPPPTEPPATDAPATELTASGEPATGPVSEPGGKTGVNPAVIVTIAAAALVIIAAAVVIISKKRSKK